MGQLPADAPCKAAHSSRNRARRMKAARAEARRLVDEARDKRDSALAELSSVKAELAKTKQEHERKCEEFKHKCAEMAAAVEAAADNAAAADEIENLKRINAETLESLDNERSKTQGLLERLGEANDQIESERSEKEEFRQEVLGLRSRLENTSGMSIDEVNGLVARAQEAENRASELAFDMSTLQNQAEDRERQLEEARESCWQLKAATDEQMKRLENHNAVLHDSVAQTKAELETVSAERDELLGKLGDSSSRIEELESSLEVERQGASHLRDSEQSSADKIGDLARENEALGKSLAQTQKARADAAAALEAVQANSESIKADLQAAREENHRQRHDYDQKIGELVRGQERLREQVQAAQGKLEEDAAEYEKRIAELQEALDSKQEEVNRAVSDSHKDELERLQKEVESERERADRAEGKARAVELLREDLESYKGKVGALRQQLSVCSNLKDDLEDAESKLMEATARATDAEGRARAAERDSSRLAKELERVNMKLADESSRADGASAALQEADGVKSLALPHGLLPGEVTTVAFGSGFQKFLVKKLIYKSDGSILAENEHGQSVSMGVWR